jgi:predicted polyphosphate/ATP-dependent NAD kinase
MMRFGLIVNPVAGLGGRVGLKGSDGAEVQQKALDLGAVPQAQARAALALQAIAPFKEQFELLAASGAMGEDIARQCGFSPVVTGQRQNGPTSAEDTIQSARKMLDQSVDLLLFAGGDGTARDIYNAVGGMLPVLGIPAGVKIYSGVFATHPFKAGEIAADFLKGKRIRLQEAEVIDLDETAYREGAVTTRLYGYLKIPVKSGLIQNKKAPTPASEQVRAEAIAAEIVERMEPGFQYIVGPGTTTRAIATRLGFPKTLVGVDVYHQNQVIALDAGESQLLSLIDPGPAKIIVTPIGGQGFLFGRGNQQISPRVIQRVGRENIIVVCLSEKLNALIGRPLLVDTGDLEIDMLLSGYIRVITGYHEQVMVRVTA